MFRAVVTKVSKLCAAVQGRDLDLLLPAGGGRRKEEEEEKQVIYI